MSKKREVKHAENQFGDGFLNAKDLLQSGIWSQFALKIEKIFLPGTIQAKNKQMIDRHVLQFENAGKRFAPCKTAATMIHYETGCSMDSDQLIGKIITVYPVVGPPFEDGKGTPWFGVENLAGIRVRITGRKAKPNIKKNDLGWDITGLTTDLEKPKEES